MIDAEDLPHRPNEDIWLDQRPDELIQCLSEWRPTLDITVDFEPTRQSTAFYDSLFPPNNDRPKIVWIPSRVQEGHEKRPTSEKLRCTVRYRPRQAHIDVPAEWRQGSHRRTTMIQREYGARWEIEEDRVDVNSYDALPPNHRAITFMEKVRHTHRNVAFNCTVLSQQMLML